MAQIDKVDDKNFNKVETVTTPINVDDLTAQINVLHQRIAQNVANFQNQAKIAIQPWLDQITALNQLINDARNAGIVPVDPDPALDTTAIVQAVDTLKTDAVAIASPPVLDEPVDTPPIIDNP